MDETWHEQFNPRRFLSHVNIEKYIKRTAADSSRTINKLEHPCILCSGKHGPGILLNDNSCLCKTCFHEVSWIQYPEKYEKQNRSYHANLEARQIARERLIEECSFRKTSRNAGIICFVSLLFVIYYPPILLITAISFFISRNASNNHQQKFMNWDMQYPVPEEPQLKHFHDPSAILSDRDKIILKIFNNWPGYPPFWDYLREVVLKRDSYHCQVSGCPSRVELHVHHKIPTSQGGEHIPSNLITLCSFHHALEPYEGHERIWGNIKSRYFTLVRSHERRNKALDGYHTVRSHVRRLELITDAQIQQIIDHYGLSCPICKDNDIKVKTVDNHQQVVIQCLQCGEQWIGKRKLTEETGPRLAEVLNITKNVGSWAPRWDMLAARNESVFRLLKGSSTHRSVKTTTRRKSQTKKKSQVPLCPICGSQMKLIKPRGYQQWKAFWGCSKYKITGCTGSRRK